MDNIVNIFAKKPVKVSMKDMVIDGAKNKTVKKAYKRASDIAYNEQRLIIEKAHALSS